MMTMSMVMTRLVMTRLVMLTMMILSSEHILHLATFALILGGLTKACIGNDENDYIIPI